MALVMVLADGETFTDLTGCYIAEVPDGLDDGDDDYFDTEDYIKQHSDGIAIIRFTEVEGRVHMEIDK